MRRCHAQFGPQSQIALNVPQFGRKLHHPHAHAPTQVAPGRGECRPKGQESRTRQGSQPGWNQRQVATTRTSHQGHGNNGIPHVKFRILQTSRRIPPGTPCGGWKGPAGLQPHTRQQVLVTGIGGTNPCGPRQYQNERHAQCPHELAIGIAHHGQGGEQGHDKADGPKEHATAVMKQRLPILIVNKQIKIEMVVVSQSVQEV